MTNRGKVLPRLPALQGKSVLDHQGECDTPLNAVFGVSCSEDVATTSAGGGKGGFPLLFVEMP